MEGDGNCQFRAIALGHYEDEREHAKVRKDAVSCIRANRAVFDITGGTGMIEIEDNNNKRSRISFGKYLKRMEEDNRWGDNMTLAAAARYLDTDIVVVTVTPVGDVINARRYGSNEGRANINAAAYHNRNTLVLGYIQNVHYVLLRNPSSGATGG